MSEYLEKRHHRYVEEKTPTIKAFLEKLCKVHSGRNPELFEITKEFNASAGDLTAHMKKEELVLFPFNHKMVKVQRSGKPLEVPHFGTVESPIEMMMHEHTLLLSWKIRTGSHKNIDPQRIKTYVDWFYKNHIESHFDLEEKYINTALDSDHEYIKKAISEHRRLQRLIEDKTDIERSLSLLEEELEKHVRFEERILFPEVQKFATKEQLDLIDKHHIEVDYQENVADEFWK